MSENEIIKQFDLRDVIKDWKMNASAEFRLLEESNGNKTTTIKWTFEPEVKQWQV